MSEVMSVPNGWEIDIIENLANITTGDKDTQDRLNEGKYPFYVRSNTVEKINSYSFDGKAVLTAGDGVGVGKVFHYVNGKFDFHQRVYCISDFSKRLNSKFFFEYFQSNFIKRVNKYSAKGSVDSVRYDMISLMNIPLPPIREQERIAKILSTLDQVIEATQKLIVKEKNIKKGLMHDLLTNGIDYKGRIRTPLTHKYKKSELGLIPEHWEVKKLADVGQCKNGLTYSPSDITNENGLLVLRSSNIQNSKLAFDDNVFVRDDIRLNYKVKEGDILVCVRNGSKNLIGKNALITKEVEGMAHGAFMTIFHSENYKYIFQLFQSDMFFQRVEKNLGATINSINNSDLILFEFPFPESKLEQEQIANILTTQDKKIEIEEKNLEKLKKLKKGLMNDLLSGKVRVEV